MLGLLDSRPPLPMSTARSRGLRPCLADTIRPGAHDTASCGRDFGPVEQRQEAAERPPIGDERSDGAGATRGRQAALGALRVLGLLSSRPPLPRVDRSKRGPSPGCSACWIAGLRSPCRPLEAGAFAPASRTQFGLEHTIRPAAAGTLVPSNNARRRPKGRRSATSEATSPGRRAADRPRLEPFPPSGGQGGSSGL